MKLKHLVHNIVFALYAGFSFVSAQGGQQTACEQTSFNAYDAKWGYIVSDNYPNAYGFGRSCSLDLQVNQQQTEYIAIKAIEWDLDHSGYGDRLSIHTYIDNQWVWQADLYAWSDPAWFLTFRSPGWVSFKWYTDYSNYLGGTRRWKLVWTYQKYVFGCELSPQPYIFNNKTLNGVIQSPFFPNHYPINSYCQTLIDVDASTDSVEFVTKIFNMREGDNLYLYTGDVAANTWTQYDVYNSTKSPPATFRIYGVDIKLLFTSDGIACSYGYQIFWRLLTKERYGLVRPEDLLGLYPLTAAHRGTDIIKNCNALNYPTDGSIVPVVGPTGTNGGALFFNSAFLNMTDPACAIRFNTSFTMSLFGHARILSIFMEFLPDPLVAGAFAAHINTDGSTNAAAANWVISGMNPHIQNYDTVGGYRINYEFLTSTWLFENGLGRFYFGNAIKKEQTSTTPLYTTNTNGFMLGMRHPILTSGLPTLIGRMSCTSIYGSSLLPDDISALQASCQKIQEQYEIYPASSLIAWYPLNGYNGNSQGARLVDVGPYGYHGVVASFGDVNFDTGPSGLARTAIVFNGSANSYASMAYNFNMLRKAFTISLWVRSTTTTRKPIIEFYNSTNSRGFVLYMYPTYTDLYIRMNVGGGTTDFIKNNVDLSNWTFLTAVWSSVTGFLNIYLNATLLISCNYGTSVNVGVGGSNGMVLGYEIGSTPRLAGSLSCLTIFNSSFTTIQIQKLMAACSRGHSTTAPLIEMMGFWPMTNLTGFQDISGNEYHGTPMSANVTFVPGPFGHPNTAIELGRDPDSYIKFPAGAGLSLGSKSFTIACWVRKSSAGFMPIIEWVASTNQPGATRDFQWWLDDDRIFVHNMATPYNAYGIGGVNKWQFLAVVYDYENQRATAYRDGAKLSDFSIASGTGSNFGFNLGKRMGDDGPYFKGQISCLSIYQLALNAEDIGRLMSMCQSYLMDGRLRQDVERPEISCNFDQGFCGWTQIQTDDLDWTLSRDASPNGQPPIYPTGPPFGKNQERIDANDQYAVVRGAGGLATFGSKAQLQSPVLPAGWHCFSFWYYLYGKDIDSFYVNLMPNGKVLFTTANKRKAWRFAAISFQSAPFDYLYFTAYVRLQGNPYSDIAVDDIRFTEGNCTSLAPCPKGWLEFGRKCYFLSAQPPMQWSGARTFCDTRFSTTLARPEEPGEMAFLQSLIGTETIHIDGAINVGVMASSTKSPLTYLPYVQGEPTSGDTCLALTANGFIGTTCTPTYGFYCEMSKLEAEYLTFNCSFDGKHHCGWWNRITDSTDATYGNIDTEVWSGLGLPWSNEDYANGPEWDWNLGNNRGYYLMSMDAGFPTCSSYMSTFSSPEMKGTGKPQCLRFRHYRTYYANKLEVILFTTPSTTEWTWVLTGNQDTAWRTVSIEFLTQKDYYFNFKLWLSCNTGGFGNLAIDDIQLFDSTCAVPTFTDKSNSDLQTIRPMPSWSDSTDSLNDANFFSCDDWPHWRSQQGPVQFPVMSPVNTTWSCNSFKHAYGYRRTGPQSDYTGESSYAQADVQTGVSLTDKARMTGPPIPSGQHCFIFHYFMHGYDMGELKLIDDKNRTLWARQGSQTPSWKEHRLLLNDLSPTTPFFEASSGLKDDVTHFQKYQSIQLDDIYTRNGSDLCLGYMDCDFDRSPYLTDCGWQQNDTDDGDWVRWWGEPPGSNLYTGPSSDLQGNGSYVFVDATGLKPGARTRIHMPVLPQGEFCLTFYYHMFGADMGSLRVFYVPQDNMANYPNKTYPPYNETEIWSRSGNKGNQWLRAMVPFQISYPQGLTFEAVRGSGDRSDIAIDEVVMLKGKCPNDRALSCSFERKDLCNWFNDPTAQVLFEVRKGKTPNSPISGPEGDNTGLYAGGYYAFLNGAKATPGQTARLISPTLPKASTVCFQLFYNMRGRQMGTLNVYENNDLKIRLRSGQTGYEWRRLRVTLKSAEPFVIKVEAVNGFNPMGDIAIDDLTVTDGPCSLHEDRVSNLEYSKTAVGFVLNNHLISSNKTLTIQECVVNCKRNPNCQSINFLGNASLCHLNNASYEQDPSAFATSVIGQHVSMANPLVQLEQRLGNLCQLDSPDCTLTAECTNPVFEAGSGMYICKCLQKGRSCFMPQDCSVLLKNDYVANSVYLIQPGLTAKRVQARCDMDLATGFGYTVIGYRFQGSVRFNLRTYREYTEFFGNPWGEYWLGLETMSTLTKLSRNGYVVDSASYNFVPNPPIVGMNPATPFLIAGPEENYRITLQTHGAYTMSTNMNNGTFSTYDRDLTGVYRCTNGIQSGWWFIHCTHGILTASYCPGCRTGNIRNAMSINDVSGAYGLAMMKWKITRI